MRRPLTAFLVAFMTKNFAAKAVFRLSAERAGA
jgi:hypothetical protein